MNELLLACIIGGGAVALGGAAAIKSLRQLPPDAIRPFVDQVNAEMGGWFDPLQVLAVIEVESKGDPQSYRYEPRLDDASYGLMQILYRTAQQMGYAGAPEGLYDPLTGIRYGMKYLQWCWYALGQKLGRDPSIEEWIGSYNAGVTGVARNGPPAGYVSAWATQLENLGGSVG